MYKKRVHVNCEQRREKKKIEDRKGLRRVLVEFFFVHALRRHFEEGKYFGKVKKGKLKTQRGESRLADYKAIK